MKEELLKQVIQKQNELIQKLQSMVDSQQDYDRDYHEIWVDLQALESEAEQSKQHSIISDPDGILQIESMDIGAKEGYKVMVTERSINNGYPHDMELANKYLKVRSIYTVEKTEGSGWHTDVWLKEFPNISFNSVHFVPFKEEKPD